MTNTFLIKLFYDGRKFHGSQRQPDVRTVEGELLNLLANLNIPVMRIVSSGRTDRGVHALSQIVLIETTASEDRILEASRKLVANGLIAWAIRLNVPYEFNPRYNVTHRRYLYVEKSNFLGRNIGKLNSVAKLFIGKKIFKCFSSYYRRIPSYIDPYRTVYSFKIYNIGEYVVFDIVADSFIKQMVRRIVASLKLYIKGKITLSDIERMLSGICSKALIIKPAKAENLILLDVNAPLTFRVFKENVHKIYNYCCKSGNIALKFICYHVTMVRDKPKIVGIDF